MTLITRDADASVDASQALYAPQITGFLAGEALAVAAPCYIKASDGKVYESNATTDGEASRVDGFTARAYALNAAVTLFGPGARFSYGAGLTIGPAYLAATAGRLDTAVTVGDRVGAARIVSATDIVVFDYRTPIEKELAVAVTAGGIHAALVNLGLITA